MPDDAFLRELPLLFLEVPSEQKLIGGEVVGLEELTEKGSFAVYLLLYYAGRPHFRYRNRGITLQNFPFFLLWGFVQLYGLAGVDVDDELGAIDFLLQFLYFGVGDYFEEAFIFV